MIELHMHRKPDHELKINLSKEQLGVLQDALGYSIWQFKKEGNDPAEAIQFLHDLYEQIKEETGISRRR